MLPVVVDWPWSSLMEFLVAVETNAVDVSPGLRLRLLTIVVGGAEPAAEIPALPGPTEDRAFSGEFGVAATALMHDSLGDASPQRFAVLLEIASVYGISISLSRLDTATARFISDWASHPARQYRSARWLCESELVAALMFELDQRISSGDPADVLAERWRPVLDRVCALSSITDRRGAAQHWPAGPGGRRAIRLYPTTDWRGRS